jgi:hypothetical protein
MKEGRFMKQTELEIEIKTERKKREHLKRLQEVIEEKRREKANDKR